MNKKMDWKKFLLYYVPVALILIVVGKVFPELVEKYTIPYYIVLVGWAFFAEQFASK